MLWSHEDAARATGGTTTGPWQASGISIDTRILQPGDLFVALRDRRDGHAFVSEAFAAGAAAALVERRDLPVPDDAPLLVVPSVQTALEAMARDRRAATGCKALAVTGSVGKTSCKDMLRLALGQQGLVHVSKKSYNNHWGVPLTLACMPRDTDYLVAEVGMNQPGEIAPLARLVRPHVGLITTVGAAHLAAFGTVDGIAREKAQLLTALEPGGAAILNRDIESFDIVVAVARQSADRIVTFGLADTADYRLYEIRNRDTATVARAATPGHEHLFKLAAIGEHHALNALGVLAALEAAGADPVMAALALQDWQPLDGRGQRIDIMIDRAVENGTLVLVDDAYNSNPTSLTAGLISLGRMTGTGSRIAILGDMLELGEAEVEIHAGLADHPAIGRLDAIHCIGPLMRHFHAALPYDKRGLWCERPEDLVSRIHQIAGIGDIVLVKGSKASGTSLVATAFRQLDTSETTSGKRVN